MPITKRTLEKWRRDSLKQVDVYKGSGLETPDIDCYRWLDINNRILRLTQELIDQHLIRRKS